MFDGTTTGAAVLAQGTSIAIAPLAKRRSAVVTHSRQKPPSPCARIEREELSPLLAPRQLEDLAAAEPDIRRQLANILKNQIFVNSAKLSRFLEFIVEHVLAGNQKYLKEYVIGSEVYERRPPYQPSQDSIVRTEARRLRGKIKEYYEAEGKDDPLYIYLRPGSYIPVFQYKEALTGVGGHAESSSLSTSAMAIAILPFRDISETPLSSVFARGIPDELAYALTRMKGCRVISPASMAPLNVQEHDVAAAMCKLGAQIAFEGSVREEGNQIRVTAKILDAAGFQLWVLRFDAEASAQTLFTIEEQFASALCAGLDNLFHLAHHS